jgi:hypothetical protein
MRGDACGAVGGGDDDDVAMAGGDLQSDARASCDGMHGQTSVKAREWKQRRCPT